MEKGQKFIAISRYSGKLAEKFSERNKGVYTFESENCSFILCRERTFNGMPVMIFHSVFEVTGLISPSPSS